MCLPLDEARELFDSEEKVFGWSRGPGKEINHVGRPCCHRVHIVPLVVIFTKRDGAVTKFTSEIISGMPGGTASRGFKKDARDKAKNNVDVDIESRKEKLKQLSHDDASIMFLTMSGMFYLAHSC